MESRIRTSVYYLVMTVVCVLAPCVFLSNSVFANVEENWNSSVVQKALLSGLRRCYSNGAINYNAGKLSDFKKFDQLIIGGDSGNYVALPSGLTKISDNDISCKGLFMGDSVGLGTETGSFKGIFELAGKSEYENDVTDLNKKITLLEGMGYAKIGSGTNKQCVYYVYRSSANDSNKRTTQQICYNGGALSVESTGDNLPPYFYFGSFGNTTTGRDLTIEYNGTKKYVSYTDYDGGWDGFVSRLSTTMSTYFSIINGLWLQGSEGTNQNDYGDAEFKMQFSTSGESADKPISFLSSYQDYDSLGFSDSERISYYVDTIKYWFYGGMDAGDYLKCDISDQTLYGTYLMINLDIVSMKKSSTCGIDTRVALGDKYAHGFIWNRGKPYFDASGNTKVYLEDVVKEINRLVENIDDEELADLTDDYEEDSQSEITCLNSGGAESLGWIVCPLMTWLSNVASDMYDNFVEPGLQIEPTLFSQSSNQGTRKAWGTFQIIANTLFIILLLIVIFSQLTGVGIDNYGIKKILPKMIVVAILVNLSYWICVICVDLSNIIGNGLQVLFNDMANNLTIGNMTIEGETFSAGSAAASTVITGVALLTVLVSTGVAIWHNPAIILSLLVSALGIVVAVLFLFVLLGAREAAIVVLTVISPLAAICYMLPNTKKFFDKWFKFGEGLLLIYPICGLLVGGGNYVSKLLLSSGLANNGFFAAFTAMIVGIIPIFFIPTVLKGAFAAMGSIGAAFANLGRNARSAATGRIRKTEGYKAVQQQGLDRAVRSKAGYSRRNDRLNAKGRLKSRFAKTGFGRIIGYGGLQSARVKAAGGLVDEEVESRAAIEQALAVSGIAKKGGDVKAYYGDMLDKAVKSGSANNVNAVVAAMVNSGQIKEKDIADLLRKRIDSTGGLGIKNDGTLANVFREMAAKYGNGFLATDAELKDFMKKGGLDKSGEKITSLGNYGDYAKAGHMDVTDVKKEDINKLSSDSIAGLIQSKIIDQGMAQQMLAMNPNISNDKRIMLGAAANALSSVGTMSAEAFKENAKRVAQDTAQATLVGMTKTMADAIVAATPQAVNVVQNFQGGGKQEDPVQTTYES